MKLRNNFLFLTIFVFLIMISSGIVFAEDSALPSVATGEVSGDIEIVSENPFAAEVTDGELVYEIPENVSLFWKWKARIWINYKYLFNSGQYH